MDRLRTGYGCRNGFSNEDILMFTIDLLKGKGLPQRTSLTQKVSRAAGLLVPLAALVILAGAWRYDNKQLESQIMAMEENEAVAKMNVNQTASYRKAKNHLSDLRKQLSEATEVLYCRVQVTDLFRELTENLPGEIFLYEIKLDRSVNKEKYQPDGAKDIKHSTIINRSLTLVLCDFDTSGGDRLVEEYMAGLRKSALVSSLFKEIKPAARQQGTVGERSATFYYIECVLVEQKHNE